MSGDRDVALVLSGGGMNGILLELGFLKRLRESAYWPRVGFVYGTSAGALAGTMAALDRLDDLEQFLLQLRSDETFRPQRLWRMPLLGLHDYALPATITERLGGTAALTAALVDSPVELSVCVTDVTETEEPGDRHFELVYSSRTTPPEIMASAVLASAAVSALVPPLVVGDRIATDGGWVRNYPLGHAYAEPRVREIVAFRYEARYPRLGTEALARLRRRLQRFRAAPPVRALIAELEEAEQRGERGEPAHLGETIVRLMRVAISRNTWLEERFADERDESIRELARLRTDVRAIVERHTTRGRRSRALAELDDRFAAARFPFRHDRELPRLTVRADAGDESLEPGFRSPQTWSLEAKRALIERGYRLTDEALGEPGAAAAGG